jgi:hypothetical protein
MNNFIQTLSNWTTLSTFVAGLATLAIYSFFIKENSFYRFFEHLYIGIAAGFAPIFTLKSFLWPKIIEPMFGLNIVVFPDGTSSAEYSSSNLLYLFPMFFGLLYYCLYSKRFSWLVKVVIGFSLGASAGLTFKGFFNEILPQIESSFKPLAVFEAGKFMPLESLYNLIFVATLLSVLYYFFFTFKRKTKIEEGTAYIGRYLMMVCFGAFFGSTVMARMVLLIERLQFLINEWVYIF